MEIERKFLVSRIPDALESFPRVRMEQAYLSTDPVIRVRRAGERCILTCKGRGTLSREEFELDMTPEAYERLSAKADGLRIVKDRYKIPLGECVAELDIFQAPLAPLVFVEVEFPTEDAANTFTPPDWFGREVTYDPAYTNAALSQNGLPENVRKSKTMTSTEPEMIDSGCTGDCTWTLDSNYILTVFGQGQMGEYDGIYRTPPWWNYRKSIKFVVIKRGVTSLGAFAFSGCIELISVTISNSVTSIKCFAFKNCNSLKQVIVSKKAKIDPKAFDSNPQQFIRY